MVALVAPGEPFLYALRHAMRVAGRSPVNETGQPGHTAQMLLERIRFGSLMVSTRHGILTPPASRMAT
jgi:hypothetical protein